MLSAMNAELFDFTSKRLLPEKTIELNVVLAYEDFSTGMHALRTFDHLFLGRHQAPQLNMQNVWKFDLLGIKKLREIAVSEAVHADMVIISAHGSGDLPADVKRWIEGWVGERQPGPGAFVILLDDTDRDASGQLAVEAYLEDCAAQAGMDYFIQKIAGRNVLEKPDDRPSTQNDWQALDILTGGALASTASPRWGINE
jgi:hypothetical protein